MYRYAYICSYEDIETYQCGELPLIRVHGKLGACRQAHETRCVSQRPCRNRPTAHREKAVPKHRLLQSHLRFVEARKPCPYSESMNPRRRSLTVVSFSSA